MLELTPVQLRLLDTALEQGLISVDCYREAKKWNAEQTRKREEWVSERLSSTRHPSIPVAGAQDRSFLVFRAHDRRSLDTRAHNLEIQILLREITVAEQERGGSSTDTRHLANLRRKLERLTQQGLTSRPPEKPQVVPEPPEKPQVVLEPPVEHSEEPATPLPAAARRAIECLEQLQQLRKILQTVAVNERLRVSVLGDVDAALCLCWSNVSPGAPVANLGSSWELLKSLGNYRECQLLSARSAELVMQTYYSTIGSPVEDISLKQLDAASEEWKTFDLRVGNRFIDVKNARQSLNGNGGYVEHCVPLFKEHRVSGEHVVIAGVLSPYKKESSFYSDERPIGTVLGEVNVVDVRNLYRWAKMRFGARLDLRGIWNTGFLPGWIFEYPNEHYPRRRSAIASIAPLLRCLSESGMYSKYLPGWMLLLCDDEPLISSLVLDERKARLVTDLRKMSSAIGFTRRSLYVYAMGLALDALAGGKSPEEDLNEFLTLIEMSTSRHNDDDFLNNEINDMRESLLGLIDPQGYVSSLAKNLMVIGQRTLDSGMQLTGFQLSHPAILKGICADGKKLTLMAFCGGWQTFPIRAKCGTTPLTLGIDKHCPSCGHLVCHNCGHCCDTCPECPPRQQEYAQAAREAMADHRDDEDTWGGIDDF